MAIAPSVQAQENELYYTGYVYSEKSETEQVFHPFVAVKVYEESKPDELVAITATGINGYYGIWGVDVEKTYVFEVEGFNVSRKKYRGYPNKGQIKSGNINVYFKVDDLGREPIEPEVFSPSDLSRNEKGSVFQLIEALPDVKLEHGSFVTKDEGTVQVLINGYSSRVMQIFQKIKDAPAKEVVRELEYYDLSAIDNTLFDGVVNVKIKVGEQASVPNFKIQNSQEEIE